MVCDSNICDFLFQVQDGKGRVGLVPFNQEGFHSFDINTAVDK